MDSQQEYNQFIAKLLKSAREAQNDFIHLSPENQRRFAQRATVFMKEYGIAISKEELLQKFLRGNGCIGNGM